MKISNLIGTLREIGEGFLEFLYPIGCRGCGKNTGEYLCQSCLEKLPYINEPKCRHCSIPLESDSSRYCKRCVAGFGSHDGGISIALYDDPVGKLIRDLKFNREKQIAPFLAKLMIQRISVKELKKLQKCDFIFPVPMTQKRTSVRGFNQSTLIASDIAQRTGLEFREDVLVKTRETPPQVGLDFDRRIENLKGVFDVRQPELIEGKSILVFDDVMTTGATIEECAITLKNAGASRVNFLTVARQIYDESTRVEDLI